MCCGWPLRIPARNQLRTVTINEALEIARRFSTYEATQFINGILDAIKARSR